MIKNISSNEEIAPGKIWKANFEGCYARFEADSTLIIGNKLVERSWQVKNGLLFSRSLRDSNAGIEWLANGSPYPVLYPQSDLPDEPRSLSIVTHTGRYVVTEEPSLVVELHFQGETLNFIYRFQVFPDASGITQQLLIEKKAPDTISKNNIEDQDNVAESLADPATRSKPTGLETSLDLTAPTGEATPLDLLDFLPLAPRHLRLIQVTLLEQTDARNEIVFENEWLLHTSEKPLTLRGNLFIIENTLTRAGLIFLKLAPLPPARPVKSAYDLRFDGPQNSFGFWGHGNDYTTDRAESAPFVILSYSNGQAGRTEVLQNYQRQYRSYEPGRDGLFLSNTWGDRSRDGRITQNFIEQEIVAAAGLGVDVLQIDDGWQTGATLNSVEKKGVWQGFREYDANFWQPNAQRFPAGLVSLVNQAKSKGMKFGLWFGADSADDFANWKRDADALLGLYRDFGVNFFKIDAIVMTSKTGEHNLRGFFRRVLDESQGEVVLELDVTADIRPGYFGMIHSGPIYVENRYTDWHNYWPHQTLRNLWKLAHYVDPLRLRMEFLNNDRNQALYEDDPLAPIAYHPAYLFATTMFANPLGFFEISNLPTAYIEEVGRLVKIWKEHRSAIYQGRTFPVGRAPDGTGWTGFVSIGKDRRSGYALIFRELSSDASWNWPLPVAIQGELKAEILWGDGTAHLKDSHLEIEINRPQDFLFLKFQPV